jgi:hypothetical protein
MWILIKYGILGPYKGYLVPLSFINAPQNCTLIRKCVLHLGAFRILCAMGKCGNWLLKYGLCLFQFSVSANIINIYVSHFE